MWGIKLAYVCDRASICKGIVNYDSCFRVRLYLLHYRGHVTVFGGWQVGRQVQWLLLKSEIDARLITGSLSFQNLKRDKVENSFQGGFSCRSLWKLERRL